MITVLTWLWSQPGGRETYMARHVNVWADMVRRNLTLDHEIACVTDMSEGIDPRVRIIDPPRDFEDVRIGTWGARRPQCLRRLAMFAPHADEIFGERFVCMDLDCVIGDSLDPLFDIKDDFRIYRGTGKKRPYNGSMMLLTAGARAQVYNEFTPAGAEYAGSIFIGSDQAWISHILGWGEKTWGPEDGVVWWGERDNAHRRVMFFPGFPKPWHTGPHDEPGKWIAKHYREREAA